MSQDESFWEFYWELRLRPMENLGKREAILAASRLVQALAARPGGQARMLEAGCGAGQIIGSLAEAHGQIPGVAESVGIDYQRAAVEAARRAYPRLRFVEGDFTDAALLAGLGRFDLVLLVNALHEVYSAAYSPALGEVDAAAGRSRVEQALARTAACLEPGGWLLLFDGLEPPGDPQAPVRLCFRTPEARAGFEVFAREYQPFRIHYRPLGEPGRVELSRRDFARYVDKSIFLGKRLWQSERFESYQYFTESEFRAAFDRLGLQIRELRAFTVNEEKWRALVEIETPGVDFPQEHVLILAAKDAPAG